MLLGGIKKVFKIPGKFQEAFVAEYFFFSPSKENVSCTKLPKYKESPQESPFYKSFLELSPCERSVQLLALWNDPSGFRAQDYAKSNTPTRERGLMRQEFCTKQQKTVLMRSSFDMFCY